MPHEVVVGYHAATRATASGAATATPSAPVVKRVKSVGKALRALRRSPRVRYAVPNFKARAAGWIPNDPGDDGPSGWQGLQWNFAGPFGVNAPDAWQNMIALGHPGGRGVTVAVLDTGVAYSARGPYLRSPDLVPGRFVAGYDFVAGDPYAQDRNGHGTHVTSTIAEATNNAFGLAGLAYGVKIMPIRVLNDQGEGYGADIASGIRWAARRGAEVINLSLEFPDSVAASGIPEVIDAINYAHRKGAFIASVSGNEGITTLTYPGRAKYVVSVGATTEHGCIARFSNRGKDLDLVAPGGGRDAPLQGDPNCRPGDKSGRNIMQITLTGSEHRRFGMPTKYRGTSFAVPHVSATAALVIASGILGPHPTPAAVEAHIKTTARDLGPPGPDHWYGAGLVNAAAATAPPAPPAPPPTPPAPPPTPPAPPPAPPVPPPPPPPVSSSG